MYTEIAQLQLQQAHAHGNSATATKLATSRTINGTSFNGTANITTSKWGTARTISLSGAVTGSASVDGSGNVTIPTNTVSNTTSVSFAKKGEATITRRGNVVTVYAVMSLGSGEAYTSTNYATLPDWAVPSASINPNETYKAAKSSTGVDLNLVATGYIMIRTTLKQIAFIANNTSSTSTASLTLTFSYVVD